jgi:hypothetical protein
MVGAYGGADRSLSDHERSFAGNQRRLPDSNPWDISDRIPGFWRHWTNANPKIMCPNAHFI